MSTDVTGGASSSTGVDEKGVPWENRAKEYERKLKEAEERLKENENIIEEIRAMREEDKPKESVEEVNKKELAEFLELGPRKYLEKVEAERRFQEELSPAAEFVRAQKGYSPEDEKRLISIESEYRLSGTPLQVVKSAWKILQSEKLEKELSNLKSDASRTTSASQQIEGAGRTVPAESLGLKRSQILDLLKKAQAKGDPRESAKYIEMLEDVRL